MRARNMKVARYVFYDTVDKEIFLPCTCYHVVHVSIVRSYFEIHATLLVDVQKLFQTDLLAYFLVF